MISRDRRNKVTDEFDETLRAVLRDNVCREEPSARVRQAVLRAAAAERRRSVDTSWSSIDQRLVSVPPCAQSGMWRNWDAQSAVGSSVMLGMLQAHLLRLRFVA